MGGVENRDYKAAWVNFWFNECVPYLDLSDFSDSFMEYTYQVICFKYALYVSCNSIILQKLCLCIPSILYIDDHMIIYVT